MTKFMRGAYASKSARRMERPPTPTPYSLSKGTRRTRLLLALEDGEFRQASIAYWAELSPQQTRADLDWLIRNGFVERGELDDGRWWGITIKGREFLSGLTAEEKTW